MFKWLRDQISIRYHKRELRRSFNELKHVVENHLAIEIADTLAQAYNAPACEQPHYWDRVYYLVTAYRGVRDAHLQRCYQLAEAVRK